jgi:hypothetical protein
VQARRKQIALVSLYTLHDRRHFVPLNKLGCQYYTFPLSGLSCAGQKVSIVVGRKRVFAVALQSKTFGEAPISAVQISRGTRAARRSSAVYVDSVSPGSPRNKG